MDRGGFFRRSCKNKRQYADRADADEAAAITMDKKRIDTPHPWPIEPYRCDVCGCWHVGHTPLRVLSQQMSAAELELIFTHLPPNSPARSIRCEVIVCSKKGPHRCEQRGGKVSAYGRVVCTHHLTDAKHYAVFSVAEAIALHRSRRQREGEKRGE